MNTLYWSVLIGSLAAVVVFFLVFLVQPKKTKNETHKERRKTLTDGKKVIIFLSEGDWKSAHEIYRRKNDPNSEETIELLEKSLQSISRKLVDVKAMIPEGKSGTVDFYKLTPLGVKKKKELLA